MGEAGPASWVATAWPLFAVTLFGWVWGSFLNTLVDRTPRKDGSGPRLTFLRPARSQCLACGRPIPWFLNLPIVSYVALRGHCHWCGTSIGLRTFAVELVTPLLFLALAWQVPWGPGLLWAFAAASLGIVALPLAWERRRLGGVAATALVLAAAGALLRWLG